MSIVLPLAALAAFSMFARATPGTSKPGASKPSRPGASKPSRPVQAVQDDIAAILRDAVEDADREASKPAPSRTAPSKPAPSRTAPSKPAPSKPAPSKPAPSKPAPVYDDFAGPGGIEPVPTTDSISPGPAGYDPDGARRMAVSLSQHLTRTGRAGYDRRLLKAFQIKAGMKPDGIYGGASRGALLYFGGKTAPSPFFPPLETVPYGGPAT